MRVTGLKASRQGQGVLSGASFEVGSGEILAITGSNGCGKTTLMRALAGLHPAEAGVIELGDTKVTSWTAAERARHGLGHLEQTATAFRGMTVRDNLRAVLELGGVSGAGERADAELESLGLEGLACRRADRLSTGQRRRMEIARALCRVPRWLLLDEPLAGLDDRESMRVKARLKSAAQSGTAILVASPRSREDFCDRTLKLDGGRIG